MTTIEKIIGEIEVWKEDLKNDLFAEWSNKIEQEEIREAINFLNSAESNLMFILQADKKSIIFNSIRSDKV